jgi:hypothetical protein
MTPPAQEVPVRIRVELDDRTLVNRRGHVSEDEIFRTEKELSGKGVLSKEKPDPTAGLGSGATYRELLEMFESFGWIIGSHDHVVQTVKVFVETAIAGPALTALINAIVRVLVDDFKKNLANSKSKDAKITLYGPDGQEIDLDSKR